MWIFVFLLVGAITSTMMLLGTRFGSAQQESLNLQGTVVVHIGETGGLSAQVAYAMEFLEANVTSLQDLPALQNLPEMGLNDSVTVIFDATWITDRVNDTNLHEFFREAASKGVALVTIGNETSNLYYALDYAGVYNSVYEENGTIVDRNPVSFNPIMAGFKMKSAVTETGKQHQYPSIFGSNAGDVDSLVQALAEW